MLVLPSNNNNTGGSGSCDVDRNYVDIGLSKKVDLTTYNNKIKELENNLTIVFETIEG